MRADDRRLGARRPERAFVIGHDAMVASHLSLMNFPDCRYIERKYVSLIDRFIADEPSIASRMASASNGKNEGTMTNPPALQRACLLGTEATQVRKASIIGNTLSHVWRVTSGL